MGSKLSIDQVQTSYCCYSMDKVIQKILFVTLLGMYLREIIDAYLNAAAETLTLPFSQMMFK